MSDIAREKGCRINVHDECRNNVFTMTIVVGRYKGYNDTLQPLALRDLDDVCEKIQELLMDYLDFIGDPGAKGRLTYEVALSSTGRMKDFRNDIVRARDPYSKRSLARMPASSFASSWLVRKIALFT